MATGSIISGLHRRRAVDPVAVRPTHSSGCCGRGGFRSQTWPASVGSRAIDLLRRRRALRRDHRSFDRPRWGGISLCCGCVDHRDWRRPYASRLAGSPCRRKRSNRELDRPAFREFSLTRRNEPDAATSLKWRGINSASSAFSHDQDPNRTLGSPVSSATC
jgi:hypothetical protein